MQLVVISPERWRVDEAATVAALFAAGLDRYHVRKPQASAAEVQQWIEAIPARWRGRLMLHQHHELVQRLSLGGCHWKDDQAGEGSIARSAGGAAASRYRRSRSCHDLGTLRASLGRFDAVFFGPLFPSLSKPGYAPNDARIGEALGALLMTRTAPERRTRVIAIGGITVDTAPRARALGFDGIAVLGAIWQASDPVEAFRALQSCCGDPRPAAAAAGPASATAGGVTTG